MANLTTVTLNGINFSLDDRGRVTIDDAITFPITDFVEVFDELMAAYRNQMVLMVAFRAENLTAIDLTFEPCSLINVADKEIPVITEEGLQVLIDMVRESIKNVNTPMLEEINRLLPPEDSIASLADAPDVEVARTALLNALTVMLSKHTGKGHVAEPKPAPVEDENVDNEGPETGGAVPTDDSGSTVVGEASTAGGAESQGGGETGSEEGGVGSGAGGGVDVGNEPGATSSEAGPGILGTNDSLSGASDEGSGKTSEGNSDGVDSLDGANANESAPDGESSGGSSGDDSDSTAGGVSAGDEMIDDETHP